MATKRKSTKLHLSSRFVQWAFIDLLVLFSVLMVRPVIGLTGLGTLMILGSLTVLANKRQIWDDYKANYKPGKSQLWNRLQEPKLVYYKLNNYLIWPATLLLGIGAIALAYMLS